MKRVLAAVVAALLLIAFAGCGSGAGKGTADPATLAPPGTLAFATFELAPQGPEKAGFDSAFGKLLGSAPEAKLGEAFTKAVQTSGKLDYLADVKPWLGDTVSVAVTRVAPKDSDFALLAASTDDDKAQAAIDKDLTGVHTAARSYRDVSYKVQDDGTANGVVAHFVVAGTEAAFKAVVDASKDGKSLADTDQWKTSVGDRANGKVGLAYADVKGVLQSLASSLPGAERVAAPLLLGMVDIHPIVATLDARANMLVVDTSSPGTKPDPRGPGAASSPLIESMPANAWLAFAVPDVGATLAKVAAALKSNPLIAAQYSQIAQQLRQRTGLDLDHDLLALGDVGLFARGASGTIVAQAPSATVRRLRALAAASTNGRLRVRGPARAANALADVPLFKEAAAVVGERPTLYVDFVRALRVAQASPHHRDDSDFKRALPRLRHVQFIAAGARRDGDLDVARAVIGLR